MEELLIHEDSAWSRNQAKNMKRFLYVLLGVFAVLISLLIVSLVGVVNSKHSLEENTGLLRAISSYWSLNANEGKNYCKHNSERNGYNPFYGGVNQNEFLSPNISKGSFLLKNGTIWIGKGGMTIKNGWVLVSNGLITGVGSGNAPDADRVYNLRGDYVTPGLIDMHSHLGVYSYPSDAGATEDGNEMTDPTFPQVRALDGLNPNDPAIPLIRSGGVTTSLVLPGSGNIMGGEGAIVKLRDGPLGEMLVPNAPRAFKMACGENPKRVYGGKGQTPMSRMGITYLIRQKFYKAAQLKTQQEDWDCQHENGKSNGDRPFDIDLEPLIAILRNEALLNVHCYKEEDLEMMVRTSKEFGFKIAAFHHGLEAWRVPKLLSKNNISAAIFADHWGFKMEGYDGSVHAAKILSTNSVNMCLKSDHPVLFAKDLIFEAAKAFHYGVDEQEAFASVSYNPAKALKLDKRIGSLEVNKEADVLIWPSHPFALGSRPSHVFVDGWLLSQNDPKEKIAYKPLKIATSTLVKSGNSACTKANNFLVRDVTVLGVDGLINYDSPSNSKVVVNKGVVTCAGSECANPEEPFDTYSVEGGFLVPGFVSLDGQLGSTEVEAEAYANDGAGPVADGPEVRAVDGSMPNIFYGRKRWAAFAGGVTSSLVSPRGYQPISGTGGFVWSIPSSDEFESEILISDKISAHSALGNRARGGVKSVSSQFAELRTFLKKSDPLSESIRNQSLPLVVDVDQADQIASLIRLKKEFNIKLVIRGGAESHRLASALAKENVSVILAPPRPIPHESFETWNGKENAATLLRNAGVSVALAMIDPGNIRNLRWEAGMAVTNGLSREDALASITTTPAKIFGQNVGTIKVGQKANFVLFNGDPLDLQSTIQLVVANGQLSCQPKQY